MSANSPNPLVPQGSLQQQTGTAKSKVRVAVFSIIAVHAVLFLGVLMQGGCKKDEPKTEIATEQPPVTSPETGAFHDNPADLNQTNGTAGAIPGTAPATGAFGEPTVGGPITPIGVGTTPTVTTPVATSTGAAPAVVDMGAGGIGAPGGIAMGEPAPSVQQYTIAKGDNFYTIATKLRTTTKKIIEANPNVNPSKLQIGQKINVPVSTSAPASRPSSSRSR